MAQIWDYIAQYNPTGFYEDNRSKSLNNDLTQVKISAANQAAAREKKIMDLQDAWANGDSEALRQLGIYAPETTKKYIENADEMLSIARPMAESVLKVAPENRAKAYQQMLQGLRNKNVDVSDMPAEYDEGMMQTLANSDPKKIEEEREYALREQELQRNQAREFARLRYAKQMQEEELQKQVSRIQAGVSAGDITPEEGKVVINALKYGVTPKGAVDRLQAEYFDANTTPERQQEIIQELEAWKNATKNSGSSAKGVEANKEYEKWLGENPDATEEEKRDKRFGLKIETGSDKVWLEQEKQRAKDNQGFLIGNGYAKDEEEANQLMGVNKASPVGQALSQETVDFLSNPLMANKNYRDAAMKEKGKNDAQKEKAVKAVEDSMRINLPRLIEAYDAAKSGEGVGIISGKLAGPVGKGKASKNYAKLQLMKNTILPSFLNKVVEAGGTSRNVDAGKEAEMFIPQLKNDMSSESLANLFDEVTYSLYGVHIDEARGKGYDDIMEIKQSRQMPATTKKSNPQKIWTVEEYFGEQ